MQDWHVETYLTTTLVTSHQTSIP